MIAIARLLLRFKYRGVVLGATLLGAIGCSISDERALRREFRIPDDARLVSMTVSPEVPGWFGREGLDISAEFELSPEDFERYLREARASGAWDPLPVSRDLIARMFGLQTYRESLKRSYEAQNRPLPSPGSIYNPTDDQRIDEWRKQLPIDVESGWCQCKTAGNDIMRYPKVPCASVEGDLNDFMFAVLDPTNRRIRIRVYTGY